MFRGRVKYILNTDNSIGVLLDGEIETKNYFVAKIHGLSVTTDKLLELKNRNISFHIFRNDETSVTPSIEII